MPADAIASSPPHNVFLTWSGDWSKAVATTLRDWMKVTIRGSRPWMSSEDIAKGSAWRSEISGKLASCRIGIVVLTPESIASSWVAFEAGAMSRAISGKVCTLLCGLDHLTTGPFAEFQDTVCTRDDILRLCRDVNNELGGDFLDEWFAADWPKLESALKGHQATFGKGQKPPPAPKADEMLAEILSTVRSLQKQQLILPADWQESFREGLRERLTHEDVSGQFEIWPKGENLPPGTVIVHSGFGRGVVQSVGTSRDGGMRTAVIDFGLQGVKTLALDYARMRKVGMVLPPDGHPPKE